MNSPEKHSRELISEIIQKIQTMLVILTLSVIIVFGSVLLIVAFPGDLSTAAVTEQALEKHPQRKSVSSENYWIAPLISDIKDAEKRELIQYGKELVAHTSLYLGPKGQVMQISNGLNCQNCHLDAGTKTFGNNYGSVAATYPKFRARSGSDEDIYKRVNDCFERSLNGNPLPEQSKEMLAIVSYINFLGSDVPKGLPAKGSGLKEMAFLDRAADQLKGKGVYETKCQLCHMANGEGVLAESGKEFTYPPLWGNQSYNDAAGLYRLSNFAKYVKYNMPLGVHHDRPQLTDEESWDVAAYINSMPRPHKEFINDWPDISKKPVDHPFGPYADNFSADQHKYGPFKPILSANKKKS